MVAYAPRVNRLIRLCFGALLLSACARERDLPRVAEWQYRMTAPRNSPPGDAGWRDEVRRNGVNDLWMRASLPPAIAPRTHLVFRAYVGELLLSADRSAVPFYVFRDPASQGRLTLHDVVLPPARLLYVRVPRAKQGAVFGTAPYLATEATLPFALRAAAIAPLRDGALQILLGIVFAIIGIIAIAASSIRRRGDVSQLRTFGVFTLLYGMRLLADSYIPLAFGVSLPAAQFARSFITYVIAVPGWILAVKLIGPGWRSTLRLQVYVFALFAPLGIASDLLTGRTDSLETLNNVLVIAGGVNILLNLLAVRLRTTRELRVVLAGASAFLLFALNNNLAALGVLPWRGVDESFGFVLFVGALGYAATRGFIRGEREQLATEQELRTAREIQLSILPRAMPDVTGLRFHAAYDPATSVAGDLYDFIGTDALHTGVLVADVAGHGVPAALIASMVKIAVSSQSRSAHDPAAILMELNAILRRDVRRAFVTATCLWLDMEERTVTVSNAGHAPPLLYRNGAFLELGGAGVLLGRFGAVTYTATSTPLQSGDRILAFTDGITEAADAKSEQFGDERLKELVAGSASLDAAGVADAVMQSVHRWRAAGADADDLTLVIIDVT